MKPMIKWCIGSILVLGCFYIGTWLSDWAELPLPGALTGLLLLLIVLFVSPSVESSVAYAVSPLLIHMSVLFVPAILGVSLYWQQIQQNALALSIAVIVSTWVSLGITAKITSKIFSLGVNDSDLSPASETPSSVPEKDSETTLVRSRTATGSAHYDDKTNKKGRRND